jgi:hypothetical protein
MIIISKKKEKKKRKIGREETYYDYKTLLKFIKI